MTAQLTRNGKPQGYGACPTHLFARLREARQGGGHGYEQCGYDFMAAVASLVPDELNNDQWADELRRIAKSSR